MPTAREDYITVSYRRQLIYRQLDIKIKKREELERTCINNYEELNKANIDATILVSIIAVLNW